MPGASLPGLLAYTKVRGWEGPAKFLNHGLLNLASTKLPHPSLGHRFGLSFVGSVSVAFDQVAPPHFEALPEAAPGLFAVSKFVENCFEVSVCGEVQEAVRILFEVRQGEEDPLWLARHEARVSSATVVFRVSDFDGNPGGVESCLRFIFARSSFFRVLNIVIALRSPS